MSEVPILNTLLRSSMSRKQSRKDIDSRNNITAPTRDIEKPSSKLLSDKEIEPSSIFQSILGNLAKREDQYKKKFWELTPPEERKPILEATKEEEDPDEIDEKQKQPELINYEHEKPGRSGEGSYLYASRFDDRFHDEDRLDRPLRIISPEGSRMVVGPDNSRIIFPAPIVHTRPLSPEYAYHPMSRVVYVEEQLPPRNVSRVLIRNQRHPSPPIRHIAPQQQVHYQAPPQRYYQQVPIQPPVEYRRVQVSPPRVEVSPARRQVPHHRVQMSPPRVQFRQMPVNNPQPHYVRVLPPQQPQQRPQQYLHPQQYLYPQQPHYQNFAQPQQQMPVASGAPAQPEPKPEETAEQQKQILQKPVQVPVQQPGMTAEDYAKLLAQQYELAQKQHEMLQQQLAMCSSKKGKSSKKRKRIIEKIIERENIINTINEKNVTIENERNVSNSQSSYSQINQANILNSMNFQQWNQANMNQYANPQYQYLMMHGMNPSQAKQLMLQNGSPIIEEGKQSSDASSKISRSSQNISSAHTSAAIPLQPEEDSVSGFGSNKKLKTNGINSSKSLLATMQVDAVQQLKPIDDSFIPQEQKDRLQDAGMAMQSLCDPLQEDELLDHQLANQLEDLRDLKKNNTKEFYSKLNKMEEIISKYSKSKHMPLREIPQNQEPESQASKMLKNLTSTIKGFVPEAASSNKPEELDKSEVVSYQHRTSLPSKQFLSLTKNMVFSQ